MITKADLEEAIAECQGVRSPTAATCIKLAAFLIIQKELYGENAESLHYSFAPYPLPRITESTEENKSGSDTVGGFGDTEFLLAIEGKKPERMWKLLDELMSVLKITQPRLYYEVLRKIND